MCGDNLLTLCVLTMVAAVTVTGKPHHRCPTASQNDYANALLAHYSEAWAAANPSSTSSAWAAANPSSTSSAWAAANPSSTSSFAAAAPDYGEVAAPCRPGRSNDQDRAADEAPLPPAARHLPGHTAVVAPHRAESAVKPASDALGPCKGPSPLPQAINEYNDTSAVLAVAAEKLKAYYDRLKEQEEYLVRRQLEQQLLEQQHRRQHDYALVQQHFQQQYYLQQQHAMLMLDQLHKNPAFVNQLAAYMQAYNKTVGAHADPAQYYVPAATHVSETAAAAVAPVPAVATTRVRAGDGIDDVGDRGRSSSNDLDRNDENDDDDDDDDGGCGAPAKRVGPRHTNDRDVSNHQQPEDEDEGPIVNKIYGMISE